MRRPRARGYSPRKAFSGAVTAMLLACAVSCGSDSSPNPTPTSPTPPGSPPAPTNIVTISPSGMSPAQATTTVGGRVTFVNNDVIPHDIAGGPDPNNPDCLEIDAVGFLTPGQNKQTAPFPAARTCQYHDHSFHSTLYTGSIVIR